MILAAVLGASLQLSAASITPSPVAETSPDYEVLDYDDEIEVDLAGKSIRAANVSRSGACRTSSNRQDFPERHRRRGAQVGRRDGRFERPFDGSY